MPPLVSSAEPQGRSLGSRPNCAVWLRDLTLPRAAGLGGPGRRLPRVPPPRPGRTAGSHYRPSPSASAPRAGGGSPRPGGGAGYNESQAGNSSRGARLGCGREGGPALRLAICPHHPSSSSSAPRIMETGPPADPPGSAPHSCFWGRAGHESCATPFGPVRRGSRGPPNPPSDLGRAPPPHSSLGRSSGRLGRPAGPATLHSIQSTLRTWFISIYPPPPRDYSSLSARGLTPGCARIVRPALNAGFSPLSIWRGRHHYAHFTGEGSEVQTEEGSDSTVGRSRNSGHLLPEAPRTALGICRLSDAPRFLSGATGRRDSARRGRACGLRILSARSGCGAGSQFPHVGRGCPPRPSERR